jgi:hypothetical protein
LALGSADEELFSEMAIQDIKIGIDWFFFYMQKLLSFKNILKQNRKCHLCNLEIGNEFHYLFICLYPQINELQIFFIPEYYLRNPSLYKLKGMLSLCNVTLYRKICGFIRKIIKYL